MSVAQNKLVDHHYTVFEVTVPALDRFMRAGIKKQEGEEPRSDRQFRPRAGAWPAVHPIQARGSSEDAFRTHPRSP